MTYQPFVLAKPLECVSPARPAPGADATKAIKHLCRLLTRDGAP